MLFGKRNNVRSVKNIFNRFGEPLFSRLAYFQPKPEIIYSLFSTHITSLRDAGGGLFRMAKNFYR